MAMHPHIVHLVGHTEADHAATAEDVIEACKLARRAIENALAGQPDMTADPRIWERRERLVAEAKKTLEAISNLAAPGVSDPFIDPVTLANAVTRGIMDAPQLKNNRFGRGQILTRIVDGQCLAVDASGTPLSEHERLANLGLGQLSMEDKP
jgi:hypothetical protein